MNKPSDYKIEKGIPVTEKKAGRQAKWPFRSMKVGDSFYVKHYTRDSMRAVSNAGRNYFRKMNPKLNVCARKEGTGFRIWVIKKKK